MTQVRQVLDALFRWAPAALKLDFDNVGLLAGAADAAVTRILVCLDATADAAREAAALGAELIVAHHPLFFLDETGAPPPETAAQAALRQAGVAAICMHTNLDAAPGGVNDCLAAALGLRQVFGPERAADGAWQGLYRVGQLPEAMPAAAFAAAVRDRLNARGVRLYDAGRPVRRVGLCSGSGMDALEDALAAGCDTFVTGEAKHHHYLLARDLGVNLVAAGHFATEAVVRPAAAARLRAWFPALEVSISAREDVPFDTVAE